MPPETFNSGDGGFEYGGEGGRGKIGLWKEQKESTLGDRVEGSVGPDFVAGVHGLKPFSDVALIISWVGAVIARPEVNVFGRVGSLEASIASVSLVAALERDTGFSSPLSVPSSSSTPLELLLSESAVIYSSALSCSSSTAVVT